MVLQRIDQLQLEWRAASCGAKRAVARRAAGAACDLRKFSGRQPAELVAVILAVAGEGDVIDGEMRLAGVGRTQHGSDAGAGRPFTAERGVGRRESHVLDIYLVRLFVIPTVIARSKATKQSSFVAASWIASLRSQ